MKNIPEKIYLQIDADGETPEDFKELSGVSWCVDKINSNDIEYSLSPSPAPDWTKEKTYDSEGTVDKEAILKKVPEENNRVISLEIAEIFLKATDSYAASLIKENEELKERVELLRTERDKFEGGDELKSRKIIMLETWRELAIESMPPMQEIGKAIGVKLGESIHDKILPAITALQSSNEELKEWRDRLIDEKNALISSNEAKDREIVELKKSVSLLHEAMVTAEQRGINKAYEEKEKEIAELAKFIENLKKDIEDMYGEQHQKEKEIESFREAVVLLNKNLVASEKEIERLEGLLKSLRHCGVDTCESCNTDWQQFKTENNL